MKNIIAGIAKANSQLGGKLSCFGAAGISPLDVETVARATIEATLNEAINGLVHVDMLARLGKN